MLVAAGCKVGGLANRVPDSWPPPPAAGEKNPIVQIHDQGAGGNCNVVKEIIYPLGAEIDVRAVRVGDETMSVLEIWGAEYQENDCLLIKPEDRELLERVCARERCIMQVGAAALVEACLG